MRYLFVAIIFLLSSCSSTYRGKDVYGADEFVLDSYKIKQGKYSILEMQGEHCDDLSSSLLEEYKDTISEDDVLKIALYHPKRVDICQAVEKIGAEVGFRVSDGFVTLPDLGPVKLEGLTLKEAEKAIGEVYAKQIEGIEVFISYQKRMVKKVELAGLVAEPNIPVDGRVRLYDILARAKLPTNANLFKSYVMRGSEVLSVDLYKLLKLGDMSQNIVMRGGDKVYIAESSSATLMVMGEVRSECVIDLPTGSLSLREALAKAGGIPFTGDKSYIQIIRGNISSPKIYLLSWEHVIHLPNASLLLMPGDIVYVASKPITEWNRFVSQILPSFNGLEVAQKGVTGVGVIVP